MLPVPVGAYHGVGTLLFPRCLSSALFIMYRVLFRDFRFGYWRYTSVEYRYTDPKSFCPLWNRTPNKTHTSASCERYLTLPAPCPHALQICINTPIMRTPPRTPSFHSRGRLVHFIMLRSRAQAHITGTLPRLDADPVHRGKIIPPAEKRHPHESR